MQLKCDQTDLDTFPDLTRNAWGGRQKVALLAIRRFKSPIAKVLLSQSRSRENNISRRKHRLQQDNTDSTMHNNRRTTREHYTTLLSKHFEHQSLFLTSSVVRLPLESRCIIIVIPPLIAKKSIVQGSLNELGLAQ